MYCFFSKNGFTSKEAITLFCMKSRANFSYVLEGDPIIILDLKGGISVTIDAERVLADIQQEIDTLEGKCIIWRDRDEVWDALEWKKDKLIIYPLGANDLGEAKKRMRQHLEKNGIHWSKKDNSDMQGRVHDESLFKRSA